MSQALYQTQQTSLHRIGTQRAEIVKKYGALMVLVLLISFNMLFTKNFAAMQTLWNILLHVSTTALVSVGMTLVIAIAGIDLSVGAIMAIAAVVSTILMSYGIVVVILGTILIASAFGLLNGAIISYMKIQPIIVTLALMIAGRGIAQVLTNGSLVDFSNPIFQFIGQGKIGSIPFPVVIMLVIVTVIYLMVRFTVFGRYIEAIGDNEEAARLAGVKVRLTKISVYVISAALASLAGMIETARLAAADATQIGLNIELDAIAAVVVGGTLMTGGKALIWGTMIGALIMEVVSTMFNYRNIPIAYSLLLKAVIIVIAILVQREKKA